MRFEDLYLGKWEFSPTDAAIHEVAKRHDMTTKRLSEIYADPKSERDWKLVLEIQAIGGPSGL